MMDTIKIRILRNKYEITNYIYFKTTASAMYKNPFGFYVYRNCYAKNKKKIYYYPKVTIYKRGRSYDLIIEFSAPKIIFGENLSELTNSNFNDVVKELNKKLQEMGIKTTSNEIKKADVLSFHPSKNILLSNGLTPQMIMRELSKLGKYKKMDINRKNYTNGGESLQFHANSHELIIYDKVADMAKAPIRSIDKFKTNTTNLPKILRYEVRLIKKTKMNEVLKRLNYIPNPTLQDIFKSKLCKQILIAYWKDFFGLNVIFSPQDTPLGTLGEITVIDQNIKTKKAIYLTGLLQLIKSEDGVGGLRSLLQESYPKSNWQKIKTDIDFLNNSLTIKPIKFLAEIEQQLKKFQPIKSTTSQQADEVCKED